MCISSHIQSHTKRSAFGGGLRAGLAANIMTSGVELRSHNNRVLQRNFAVWSTIVGGGHVNRDFGFSRVELYGCLALGI